MSENIRACCSASRNQVEKQESIDVCEGSTTIQRLEGDKDFSDTLLYQKSWLRLEEL
jgi:formylglycine-generating enzyme